MYSRLTRSLYRHKVRECIRIGYIPGNWDQKVVVKNPCLTKKKLKRLKKNGKLGNWIFNNIRHQYKNNVIEFPECCETEKNELLDEGFSSLRAINEISYRIQYHTLGLIL